MPMTRHEFGNRLAFVAYEAANAIEYPQHAAGELTLGPKLQTAMREAILAELDKMIASGVGFVSATERKPTIHPAAAEGAKDENGPSTCGPRGARDASGLLYSL